VVADEECSPEVVVVIVSVDVKGHCDGLNIKKRNERTKCQGIPMTHFEMGQKQFQLKPHHCPSSVVATTSVAEYRRLGRYFLSQNGSIVWIEFRSGDRVVVCGMPEAQAVTRRIIFTLSNELMQGSVCLCSYKLCRSFTRSACMLR
jgi:hypothetical protein